MVYVPFDPLQGVTLGEGGGARRARTPTTPGERRGAFAAVSGRRFGKLNFPEDESRRWSICGSDWSNRARTLRQPSISTLLDLS